MEGIVCGELAPKENFAHTWDVPAIQRTNFEHTLLCATVRPVNNCGVVTDLKRVTCTRADTNSQDFDFKIASNRIYSPNGHDAGAIRRQGCIYSTSRRQIGV